MCRPRSFGFGGDNIILEYNVKFYDCSIAVSVINQCFTELIYYTILYSASYSLSLRRVPT